MLVDREVKVSGIGTDGNQKRSTLTILLAAGEVALRAVRAEEIELDRELVADLERLIERLRAELDAAEAGWRTTR